MKQYMPMKPVKRGFKVWVRADAVTGYFCDFDIYVGKPSDGTTTEVCLGERVVLKLSECLRGHHYQLYCDNYFITCDLLDTLLTHDLYACGTTRSLRRGFPETLKQVTLERGGATILSARQPCGVCLDGQETCQHAIHSCPGRRHTHCTEKAEGWLQSLCAVH